MLLKHKPIIGNDKNINQVKMKATLEFNLPEEIEEFETANKAPSYKSTIDKMDEYLRVELKHGNYSDEEAIILERVRKEFFKIQNDRNA